MSECKLNLYIHSPILIEKGGISFLMVETSITPNKTPFVLIIIVFYVVFQRKKTVNNAFA